MGDSTFAKNANIQYMYGRANGNGRSVLRIYIYYAQLHDRRMPDHRIFQRLHRQLRVKHVRSTLPNMMLVDEELYLVQASKKTFRTLWLIDLSQLQELMLIT
ncbi:hypothetical protein TNCV_2936801 [Trichonephila clavipes]|nr:hypothetical protein TNCV_2936801 [Trichonephila clavipes]